MTRRRAYLLIVDLIFVFVLQALQPSLRAQSGGGATTPGSCVASDMKGTRPIPDGKKWYPVQLATSHTSAACPARNVQIVELRGWIHGISPTCNGDDPDWHYQLEVDSAWAWSQRIDLSRLFRVGDIYFNAYLPSNTGAREKAVSTPTVELELWGWRPSDHPQQPLPAGWRFTNAAGCPEVSWPFNPLNPTGQNPLAEGQYVRVVGSLVTDEPHEHQAGLPTFACGNFGLLCSDLAKDNDIKIAWGNGINDRPEDPMRWTEFHPPDLIEGLPDPGHKETLRGIAVLSEHCLAGHCAAQTVDEDIALPAACPSGYRLDYQELVGTAPNETNLNTVEDGNAGLHGSNTGAQITVGANSIHVHVMVRGRSANGAYGRFKALYRVFCSVPPRPLSAKASIVGQSPLTVAVTVTDPGTKLPVPGVDVWVDGAYQAQSGAKTAADGTVRLQFGACPQSGPQSIPGARFPGAPSPACPIHAGSYGYQRVDLWTPVLAAKARLSSTNRFSGSVTDPLTKTPVGDATVNLLDVQGRTLVSGKTASDGTVTLDSSGCSKAALAPLASCRGLVMKAGYLNCSFVVTVAGEGQCSGDYAGATAAASPPPVSIINQPVSQVAFIGQPVTFSVTATGTAPLSYQWWKNGTVINGAASASYVTPPVTRTDYGAEFKVLVKNSSESLWSGAATINPAATPGITKQPVSQTTSIGQTVTFSVTAGGAAPLSYQWWKNRKPISGATSSTYVTPPVTASDYGAEFAVVVSNAGGRISSFVATIYRPGPPLSASACATIDGKSCLAAGQVRLPGSALMDIVTVSWGGAPLNGVTVAVVYPEGANLSAGAVSNAIGKAVITYEPCFLDAPNSAELKVGREPTPVRPTGPVKRMSPGGTVQCTATVSAPGYRSVGLTLP